MPPHSHPDRHSGFVLGGIWYFAEQVFGNLLSNAVKFTMGRTPAIIEIGSKQTEREMLFLIRDNGAGFEMKHASKLFGVFQRLAQPERARRLGRRPVDRTAKIVERHGGRIWAESVPGQGATFSFTLPA